MSQEPEKQNHEGEDGLQHAAEHARPGKRNPVLLYLVILFAAAFLLLLMSYLMQRRSNQVAMENWQQTSNSAAQSLENIINERDRLLEQVEALEKEQTRLEDALNSSRRTADGLEEELAQNRLALEAMEYFWQVDDYYARGFYTQARALITRMEEKKLPAALPAENHTGTDRFSPAQRYQEIRDALLD